MQKFIIMFPIEKVVGKDITSWAKKHIPSNCLFEGKGYDKSPHITLLNSMKEESEANITSAMDAQTEFEVNFGEISKFEKPEKGYDVIKIDIPCKALQEIYQSIMGKIEVEDPNGQYVPHVTLAYVKPGSCDNLLGNKDFIGKKTLIDGYVYDEKSPDKVRRMACRTQEPLKESLDYIQKSNIIDSVEGLLLDNNKNIKDITINELEGIINQFKSNNSNKNV